MKVCYVTHMPNLSGATQSLLDMLDGLSGTEVEPVVLLNSRGPLVRKLKEKKIPYKIIPYAPGTDSDVFYKKAGKALLNSKIPYWIALNQIKKFYIENKIDIVHNNSYLVGIGMHAALEVGIPYVCHLREFVQEGFHRSFFRDALQRQLLNSASCRIAISESVRKRYSRDTAQDILVLNDGIKTSNYRLPLKRVLEGDKISVLITGRVTPQKGQMEAVMALERLVKRTDKAVELLVAGDFADKKYAQELVKYIQEKKLGFVKFLGFSENLREIRQHCDIGLSCSKSEALGRVTIESMLSSLLVISSDDEVAKELVTDRVDGRLYRKGDAESLSKVLEEVIADTDAANKLVENAYSGAERFDYKHYAQRVLEIYRELLEKTEFVPGGQ